MIAKYKGGIITGSPIDYKRRSMFFKAWHIPLLAHLPVVN
jgi:hypothetical protein